MYIQVNMYIQVEVNKMKKNNEKPVYLQVEEDLRNDILSGKYNKGDYIPAEAQLCKQYDTTRATVRNALTRLIGDGLITSVKGKGYYVTLNKIKYSIWNFSGFTDMVNSKGKTPKSKVLENKIVNIDNEDYLCLKRVRSIAEESNGALTIDTSYLPMKYFEGLETYDFEDESLYRVIKEEYGIIPKEVEFSIKPVAGNKDTDAYFVSEENSFLFLEGVVYDENRNAIEKVNVIYSELVDFKIISSVM